MLEPLSVIAEKYSLSSWLDVWLTLYKSPMVKSGTAEMYAGIIRLIKKTRYADILLNDITENEIQNLLNGLQDKGKSTGNRVYSKSYLSKVRLTLKQAFDRAQKSLGLSKNPVLSVTLPLSPTKEVLPLTHAEQECIECACTNDPLGDVFLFLLKTGLRSIEVRNLRWCDYDESNSLIHITVSKTKAGLRSVYLIEEAKEMIERQPKYCPFVFTSSKKRKISESALCTAAKRLRNATNILGFTTHVCRHTFVTRLCEKKVPAKAIAQIIGHANANYVLNIYAQLESMELRKAIYALETDKARCGDSVEITLLFNKKMYQELVRKAYEKGFPIDEYLYHEIEKQCH